MDAFGNILWARWVGALQGNVEMVPIASGGVVFGMSLSPNDNFSLWKFSAAGNLVWSSNYVPTPSGSGLSPLSILENSNGEILISYAMSSTNTFAQAVDNFIIKLNSGGGFISGKSYGGLYTDHSQIIANTNDGGTIMCGITNSAGNGADDVSLIKLTAGGAVQWAKAYGTSWAEKPSSVSQTADGGYVFTGQTWSFGNSFDSSKVYLVKTNNLGNTACNSFSWTPTVINQTITVGSASTPINYTFTQINPINWTINNRNFHTVNICNPVTGLTNNISESNNWNIYPNPFSSNATIRSETKYGSAIFEMFNMYGQKVKEVQLSDVKSDISREGLTDGIYFYRINSGAQILQHGKIIIK